ncbi:hypothetical protein PO909_018398 [Leuciscus waleckii]
MNLILWGIVLLGIYVQQSVSQIDCYSAFSVSTGKCGDLLGQVEKDACCLNPNYGYTESDGVCRSCWPQAAWTQWSSWSECSMSCTEGVRQRRRSCYGNGACSDPENLGTVQTEPCEENKCCPVEGGWSEWGKWQPCSVTCKKGLTKRQRTCSSPLPQCGGSCIGEEEETIPCDTEIICPTHGGWSSWGGWGPCPVTCIVEGHNIQRESRKRTCNNPTRSMVPLGRDCEGSDTDTRPCSGLPFCPIDGNWGSWAGSSPCSVSCGVGQQLQRRLCDSPKPTHGGRPCQGEEQIQDLCTIRVPCPIDGMWTEWGEWGPCKKPSMREINCRVREGNRRRDRDCDGRKYEGNFCEGDIVQHERCFDIKDCKMKGVLSEWSEWSYCKPNCGPDSAQTRERICVPDISAYPTQDLNKFSGKPKVDCNDVENQTERRPCKNVPECKG